MIKLKYTVTVNNDTSHHVSGFIASDAVSNAILTMEGESCKWNFAEISSRFPITDSWQIFLYSSVVTFCSPKLTTCTSFICTTQSNHPAFSETPAKTPSQRLFFGYLFSRQICTHLQRCRLTWCRSPPIRFIWESKASTDKIVTDGPPVQDEAKQSFGWQLKAPFPGWLSTFSKFHGKFVYIWIRRYCIRFVKIWVF